MQTLIVLFALVAQDPVVVSGEKIGGATGALEIHLPADYRFEAASAEVTFQSGEYLTKPPQSSNGRHAWTGLQPGVVNVLFRDASSMLVACVHIEPGVSKRFQFDPQRLIPARGTVTNGAGAVVSAVSTTSHWTSDGIALKTWAKADAQGAYTVRVLPQMRVVDPAYAAMKFGEGDRRCTLVPNMWVEVYVDDDSPQNFRIDGSIREIGGRRFFVASGIYEGEFSKEHPTPASLDLPAFRLIPCDRSFDAKLPAQGTLHAFAFGKSFVTLGPGVSQWIELPQGLLPATRVLFVFTPDDPSTAAFAYTVADLATTSRGSLSLDALGTVRGKIAGFDRNGEIQQAYVQRGVTFAPSELETVDGVRDLFTVFADKEGRFEGRIPAGSYKASAYATVATKIESLRDRDVPVYEVAMKLLERLRNEKRSPESIDVTLTPGGTKDVNFQISK